MDDSNKIRRDGERVDSSRVTKPVVTDMNCVNPVHRSIGNMYLNESNTKIHILSPNVLLLIIVNDMYCVRRVHRSIRNTYLNKSNTKLKPWSHVLLLITVNDMSCVRLVHKSIGNTYLNESNNKLKPWFSVSLLSGKVVGCYECVVQVKYYSFFV